MLKTEIVKDRLYMHKECSTVQDGEDWLFVIEQEEKEICEMHDLLAIDKDYHLFEVIEDEDGEWREVEYPGEHYEREEF